MNMPTMQSSFAAERSFHTAKRKKRSKLMSDKPLSKSVSEPINPAISDGAAQDSKSEASARARGTDQHEESEILDPAAPAAGQGPTDAEEASATPAQENGPAAILSDAPKLVI